MNTKDTTTQPNEDTNEGVEETTEKTEETPKDEGATEEVPEEKSDEPTVGEFSKEEAAAEEVEAKEQAKQEGVPLHVVKALREEVRTLKEELQSTNKPKIDDSDLQELSDKYNVDPNFLSDLYSTIDRKNASKYEKDIAALKKRDAQERIDKAFNQAYTKVIEKLPEYKKIVNPNVIKKLSLDPENKDKRISDLIKETYGDALKGSGKQTLEETTPGGENEPQQLDFAKAQKDSEYYDKIMKNPKLREKYNEEMLKQVKL